MASNTILKYRALPSHQEITFLIDQLNRKDLASFDQVHFIPPDKSVYKKTRRYDEFGVPSSHFRQNYPLMLKGALREIGAEELFWNFYGHITVGKKIEESGKSRVLVIDMQKMYENI